MISPIHILQFLFAAAVAVTAASPLAAQQWPTRTIRIVTGTPAGGSPDFVSRLLAEKLSERLGQSVVVEGYPMVVATAPTSPIQSFADLIARARAAPYAVTYGMNLPGSVHHLTGELINVEAGTSMRGIPYRGNTQIVQDLLGGRLDVMIETGTIAFAQIKGGTLRGLAVSSQQRFVLEPDIPAIGETLPGFAVMSWLGLAAPGGTPRSIVERLNREVGEILERPDIRDRLAGVGNIAMPSTPEQMQDYIERDAARWSRVVDIKGIERY